ncbi:hypothetical protein eimer1508.tmp1 [Eimeria tenella]|uniref:Uncharacterized protein n=1 Tax=Eimeria tenella TaxID=5802 RepID=C8TDP8_EIMTE|nr:hypothetical protein eimer1508.tmp1 [Eimeria tenella]
MKNPKNVPQGLLVPRGPPAASSAPPTASAPRPGFPTCG